MKPKQYYLFWGSIALLCVGAFIATYSAGTLLMAKEDSCPTQVIQIKCIEVPIKIELHESIK